MRGEQALDFRPGNNTAEPSAAPTLLLVLLLPSYCLYCMPLQGSGHILEALYSSTRREAQVHKKPIA